MIHTVITCDECRPDGETSPSMNMGRGLYEGTVRSAADIGWVFDDKDRNICIDCQDEAEDRRKP